MIEKKKIAHSWKRFVFPKGRCTRNPSLLSKDHNGPIKPCVLVWQNLEEKHALRVQLEMKVDDLWQQFRQALQNYNETTEERKTAFEALKVKDEKSAKEIELQMRKLQRISVSWITLAVVIWNLCLVRSRIAHTQTHTCTNTHKHTHACACPHTHTHTHWLLEYIR